MPTFHHVFRIGLVLINILFVSSLASAADFAYTVETCKTDLIKTPITGKTASVCTSANVVTIRSCVVAKINDALSNGDTNTTELYVNKRNDGYRATCFATVLGAGTVVSTTAASGPVGLENCEGRSTQEFQKCQINNAKIYTDYKNQLAAEAQKKAAAKQNNNASLATGAAGLQAVGQIAPSVIDSVSGNGSNSNSNNQGSGSDRVSPGQGSGGYRISDSSTAAVKSTGIPAAAPPTVKVAGSPEGLKPGESNQDIGTTSIDKSSKLSIDEQQKIAIKEFESGKAEAMAEAKSLGLEKEVDKVSNGAEETKTASKNNDTEIQLAGQARSKELEKAMSEVLKRLEENKFNVTPNYSNPSGDTFTDFKPLYDSIDTFVKNKVVALNQARDGKEKCAKKASEAEKWCVEGNNDISKGVRTLMDLAGPAILALNSIQRTCGATNKISKFATGALTVAHGACTIQKMFCENECDTGLKEFQKAQAELDQVYNTNIKIAEDNALKVCNGFVQSANNWHAYETCLAKSNNCSHAVPKTVHITLTKFATSSDLKPTYGDSFPLNCSPDSATCSARAQSCMSELTAKSKIAWVTGNDVKKIANDENVKTVRGSVANLYQGCQDKTRNLIGLASNIGGFVMASKNSKKCAQATATTGGDDGELPIATAAVMKDYCATNSDTQYCKCQSNSSAPGCGSTLLSNNNINAAQEAGGVALTSGRGASSFAGAGYGNSAVNAAGGAGRYVAGGDEATAATQSALGELGSANPTEYKVTGAGTKGGGAGGEAGSVAAVGDSAGNAVKPEEKKWSFGAFASSVGASLGLGSGSSRSGGSGNGDASGASSRVSMEERINRKIASDEYASQVSTSTGADNFSKVKSRYVQKSESFMSNP